QSHTHPTSLYILLNAPPTTETYTLSLHDALPIFNRCDDVAPKWTHGHCRRRAPCRADPHRGHAGRSRAARRRRQLPSGFRTPPGDRKSTRLNSSHVKISYAVFCLKKKKTKMVKRA